MIFISILARFLAKLFFIYVFIFVLFIRNLLFLVKSLYFLDLQFFQLGLWVLFDIWCFDNFQLKTELFSLFFGWISCFFYFDYLLKLATRINQNYVWHKCFEPCCLWPFKPCVLVRTMSFPITGSSRLNNVYVHSNNNSNIYSTYDNSCTYCSTFMYLCWFEWCVSIWALTQILVQHLVVHILPIVWMKFTHVWTTTQIHILLTAFH